MLTQSCVTMAATVLVAVGTATAADGQRRGAVELAAGAGREIVQTTCAECHGLNLITNSWGNTREGWQELLSSMVELEPSESSRITAYGATSAASTPRQVSSASGPRRAGPSRSRTESR